MSREFTLNEIAAGGGIFEGRYSQTLAREILEIKRELRDPGGNHELRVALEHAESEVKHWRDSQMRTYQRLEAATRERDEALASAEDRWTELKAALRDTDLMQQGRDRARAALDTYGRHSDGCHCGFLSALEGKA